MEKKRKCHKSILWLSHKEYITGKIFKTLAIDITEPGREVCNVVVCKRPNSSSSTLETKGKYLKWQNQEIII